MGGDPRYSWSSVVFYQSNTDLGLEDDDQHAVKIDAHYEHAELLALLVNAVEVSLMHHIGDRLVRHEGAGSQGRDSGQVELTGVPLTADEKPALINDQRRGGIRPGEQLFESVLQALDIFLDKLGKSGHVMRTAAFLD